MKRVGLTVLLSFSLLVQTVWAAQVSTEKKPSTLSSLVDVLTKKEKATPVLDGVLISKKNVSSKPTTPEKSLVTDKKSSTKTFPKNAKKAEKFVTGIVSYIRKDKIAVEISSNEETGSEEMLLPIGRDLKLNKVKKLSDIAQGDQVEVKYRQVFLEPKEKSGEREILDTTALEISRLRTVVEMKAEAQKAAALQIAQQPAPIDPEGGEL